MKKLLLFLLILSMFMVSCGGPSKDEAIEKGIQEADANQEAIKEDEGDAKPSNDENASEDASDDASAKTDANAKLDYAVSIDGEDYGYIESVGGRLFNVASLNKIMARFWKNGEYADDKALDAVSDYTKPIDDDEILYGVYPSSMEFLMTFNQRYNVSYTYTADDEGFSNFSYIKHDAEDAKLLEDALYLDIKYLGGIFAFKYELDDENKVLVIDSHGEYEDGMTELASDGYDSPVDLLKAKFDN